MELLERYQTGECDAVYRELVRNPAHPDANAVAAEMMKRVRANLEVLAERWRERGFELAEPIGDRGSQAAQLADMDGELPPALRAFYEELGWVDFVEDPPDETWPDVEHVDPIQVFALDGRARGDAEDVLYICDDALHKFDISGVGPIYVPLPVAEGFDPVLFFEGEAMRIDGPLTFVQYLRLTILDRGGIGLACPDDMISDELVEELVDGLVPF